MTIKIINQTLGATLGVTLAATLVSASAEASNSNNQTTVQARSQSARSPDFNALAQAVQASPASDLAHYKLANALLGSGRKDEALAEYKKAYSLSRSDQISSACAKALAYYRERLPDLSHDSIQRRVARAALPESTHGSLDEFLAMAGNGGSSHHGAMDSNPGGVQPFKQCPEAGPLAEPWRKWNQDFRIAFEARLRRRLAGLGIPSIYGRTKLIFSVDKNRHLRSRVLESTVQPLIWSCMLETTRLMENTSTLDFPAGSQIDGFNFTIGWAYPDPPVEVQERVAALMRVNRVNANIAHGTGLNATALKLNSQGTSAELNNVNGKVMPAQGLQGKMLGLDKQQTAASLLPKIDAEVSGMVVPKPKQEELKGKAGKL